ncbi:MAG: hypothetical protein ACK40G_07785 [Cytophagaceae bacterium]
MKKTSILLSAIILIAAACEQKQQEAQTVDTTSVQQQIQEPVVSLEEVWRSDSTFQTPESVLLNSDKNILYVSNVNGKPDEKNNKGFISQLGLDGKIINLEWVKGLHAPKGMGYFNGKLYVTDIDKLIEIDTEKGKITKSYPVAGSKFLNDIFVDKDGSVFISDSHTHKIHVFKDGKITEWLSEGLSEPNGIYIIDNTLYLASMGSQDFKAFNMETKKDTVLGTGLGAGDGVIHTGEGESFVVSNWHGQIFYISNGQTIKLLDTIEQKINAADIEYIKDQNLVLVPTFFDNRVVAYRLKK